MAWRTMGGGRPKENRTGSLRGRGQVYSVYGPPHTLTDTGVELSQGYSLHIMLVLQYTQVRSRTEADDLRL